MIFTSPSSARWDYDVAATPTPVRPELRGKRKKTPAKRPPVATELRMDGQVTVHAIAYAAVQVCVSFITLPDLHRYPSFTSPSMMPHNG